MYSYRFDVFRSGAQSLYTRTPSIHFLSSRRALHRLNAAPLPDDLVLEGIRIVLVAPKTEANIGAAARACGNFEAPQLWIVAPRCDPESEEVTKVACGTAITDRIVIVDSLEEALGDTVGSVGFTRRAGATRYTHASIGDMLYQFPDAITQLTVAAHTPQTASVLPPWRSSTAHSLQDSPFSSTKATAITALVFGREESGLTEQELRLVRHACAIPSGRIQPSLNLSHAVAVVLSECFCRATLLRDEVLAASTSGRGAGRDEAAHQLHSSFQATASSDPSAEVLQGAQLSHTSSSQDQASMDIFESQPQPTVKPEAEPRSNGSALDPRWFWGQISPRALAVSIEGTMPGPLEVATASELEVLLKKVAAVAEAVGVK
ncbi:hypothetical protein CEUSTIGMA_g13004.t1 [Chlamydomonas eustigma]|uniref:tRNA/rRNA methyltransferase SpoU type domain-containing protein n=1 Tax=Chlamydomonas eustigma TaxID=1157962 RepID=A0A250XRL5_9CHLO|nr:hypothetical protein CEUSTIGMA_g13004.t1 [Chlamydomonas eustigma]|eukprot:GAX85589.1 hypothetical protein CEUSTIGMA_g13004.t1 [Chlamydomonas eustigma]